MLLPHDLDVAAASPDELRRLVAELLGEVARLRNENAALREEIARLKGLKGRPKIKPSGMERAAPERTLRTKPKRSKRGTTTKRAVPRTVHTVFAGLRAQLGWVARGTHPAPRIHDLRHTFICRRVVLWQAHGTDLDHAMLALSTYVGHAKVTDTYWYLTAVPDLMAGAGRPFEGFARPVEEARHG